MRFLGKDEVLKCRGLGVFFRLFVKLVFSSSETDRQYWYHWKLINVRNVRKGVKNRFLE